MKLKESFLKEVRAGWLQKATPNTAIREPICLKSIRG